MTPLETAKIEAVKKRCRVFLELYISNGKNQLRMLQADLRSNSGPVRNGAAIILERILMANTAEAAVPLVQQLLRELR